MTDVGIVGAGVMGRRAVEKIAAAGRRVLVSTCSSRCRALSVVAGVTAVTRPAAPRRRRTSSSCISPALESPSQHGRLARSRARRGGHHQSTVDPATPQRMAALAKPNRSATSMHPPWAGRRWSSWALPSVSVGDLSDAGGAEPRRGQDLPHRPVGFGNQVKLLNQLSSAPSTQ
jgi:hypothetical protein